MKKKLFTMMIPLMVLLLVFGIGCKQAASGPSEVKVTGLEWVTVWEEAGLQILEGETETLEVKVLPGNATNKNVIWETDKDGVVKLVPGTNGTCKVEALAAGEVLVTPKTADGGLKVKEHPSFKVTVKEPVPLTGISLPESMKLGIGDSIELKVTFEPEDATNKEIKWTFSPENDKITLTPGEDGKCTITAKADCEEAEITVTAIRGEDETFTAECKVSVVAPVAVTAVSLDKSELKLKDGDTATLTATITPDDATNKILDWTVNKEGIIKLTPAEDGSSCLVETLDASKVETVTVTAKSTDGSNKTATCEVTIEPVKVEGVSLNRTALTVILGEEAQTLTATVKPDNATDKTVTWKADPEAAVELTDNGDGTCSVKAKEGITKIETVTVTATTKDGSKTATCTVTVKPVLIQSIYFSGYPHASVGGTFILESVFYPENATNKKLDWTATVEGNPSGHITLEPSEDGTACTVTIAKGFGKDPKEITFKAAATDGSKQSVTYTVTPTWEPVTEIRLNKPTLALKNGESAILTATVLPENASDKTVTWAIDGTAATMTANGDGTCTVTAVGAGTATVTVTGTDVPDIKAVCQISVDLLGNTAFIEAVGDKCTWTKEEDGTVKLTPENLAVMAAVTELDLSNKGLTDLGGIEYFTGLTDLNIYSNNLTSLDVSQNTNLTELDCSYNKLTELDVSQLTALTSLFCNGNELTELDVSGLTALTVLYCGQNDLSKLDVSKNTELINLRCDDNGFLSELNLSANTKLEELNCYRCNLTSLDLSANTKLTSLSVGSQALTFDLSSNTELVSLDCRYCSLTELDLSKQTKLESLICNDNQLTTLNLSANTALKELVCYNNTLTELDLSANTALKRLECWSSKLTSLNLSGVVALEKLICESNSLTTLDLSTNTALRDLNCGKNNLTALDVSNNTNLSQLRCYQNKLTTLDITDTDLENGWLSCGQQLDSDGNQTQKLTLTLTSAQKSQWDINWSLDGFNTNVKPTVK